MNDLINDLASIELMVRSLEKNNSKLENGHFIQAHSSNDALIANLKSVKIDIISLDTKPKTILEDINFLDKFIRELEKINSKIENGNIVFAWRDNRRVLSNLVSIKSEILRKSQED